MRTQKALLLRGVPLLVALLVAMGMVLSLTHRAEAQIDISGDWNVTISGDVSDTCTGTFTQSGTALSATLTCVTVGQVTCSSGTIDPATGDFTLSCLVSTLSVSLAGTASPDGNSIDGTFSVAVSLSPPVSLSGTFAGTRVQPATATPPQATATAAAAALPPTGAGGGSGGADWTWLMALLAGAAVAGAAGYGALWLRSHRL